jgi:hypothetical protein
MSSKCNPEPFHPTPESEIVGGLLLVLLFGLNTTVSTRCLNNGRYIDRGSVDTCYFNSRKSRR